MAFLRYARANNVKTISPKTWNHNIRAASTRGTLSPNLVEQASEILQENFSPSQYLLSHATIVCSVETESPDNFKVGSFKEGSTQINRRYNDFRIQPESNCYINNNNDAWAREVLSKSYQTFIGAHNFVEHIQVEDLSKGRIIDTIARDIGPSLYVDILIATNRKHEQLIKDINSHKMSSLSMGCFVAGTLISLSDGSTVSIENIIPGSFVKTHKGRSREVTNLQIRKGLWSIRSIEVGGLTSRIETTDTHPFFVYSEGENGGELKEVKAGDLSVGDFLYHPQGEGSTAKYETGETLFPISHITSSELSGWVYDLEVDEDHSYIAGGVAVHNCSVDATICTKCGHVAADETEMCSHVKYHKGDTFYDNKGQSHRVAELCGHDDMGEHGGVNFIEASWVGVPAFEGAVLRNILQVESVSPEMLKRAEDVFRTPSKWTSNDPSGLVKAAALNAISSVSRESFDFGDMDDDEDEDAEESGGGSSSKTTLEELEDDVLKMVTKNVNKRLREQMGTGAMKAPDHPTANKPTALNDSFQKTSMDTARIYQVGLESIVRTASSGANMVHRLAAYNMAFGIKIPRHVYEVAIKVGATDKYNGSLKRYLRACKKVMGRRPSMRETKVLIKFGKLISLQGRH